MSQNNIEGYSKMLTRSKKKLLENKNNREYNSESDDDYVPEESHLSGEETDDSIDGYGNIRGLIEYDEDLEEVVNISIVDDGEEDPDDDIDSKFIDIGLDPDPGDEEEADPRDEFGIEGKDVTGRNMAYSSFKKIESSSYKTWNLIKCL